MTKRMHEVADDSSSLRLDVDCPESSFEAFARSFKADWPQATKPTQVQIVNEIIEAILDALAGERKLDIAGWSELARWGWDRLDCAQRRELPNCFAWQQISWSLDRILFRGDIP